MPRLLSGARPIPRCSSVPLTGGAAEGYLDIDCVGGVGYPRLSQPSLVVPLGSPPNELNCRSMEFPGEDVAEQLTPKDRFEYLVKQEDFERAERRGLEQRAATLTAALLISITVAAAIARGASHSLVASLGELALLLALLVVVWRVIGIVWVLVVPPTVEVHSKSKDDSPGRRGRLLARLRHRRAEVSESGEDPKPAEDSKPADDLGPRLSLSNPRQVVIFILWLPSERKRRDAARTPYRNALQENRRLVRELGTEWEDAIKNQRIVVDDLRRSNRRLLEAIRLATGDLPKIFWQS